MSTSSVTSSGGLNSLLASSASSGTSASTAGSAQNLSNTFLTLLVAQMNNQDPLNPVDNNQLTTQMAQISTVTGINNLNTSVNSLLTQLQQSSAIQSAQLTGHSVMVAGSGLDLNANTSSGSTTGVSAVGGINLGAAAQSVTVTITDASGATVRTLQLGNQPAGFQDFTWDGKTDAGATAAAGSYTFTANAAASDGSTVAATPYNLQSVIGAVPQSDGSTQLMLGNGSQAAYGSVKQII